MIKNDKAYTFLITRKTREKISIRRIEVRKSHLHAGVMGSFVLVCFMWLSLALPAGNGEVLAESSAPAETTLEESVSADATETFSDEPQAADDAVEPEAVSEPEPERAKVSETPERRFLATPSPKLVATTADSRPFTVRTGGPSFKNANEEPLDDVPTSGVDARVRQIKMLADPAYLPVRWALRGKINNEFGYRRNPFGGRSYEFHGGIDIDGDHGEEIIAPANGVVIRAGWAGGYGNVIEIDHGYGLTTRYGHLSRISVRVGDNVSVGTLLGLVGSTGRSTGPHLHFEVRINDKAINPRLFLSGRSVVKQ